jgi:hypothetical protein
MAAEVCAFAFAPFFYRPGEEFLFLYGFLPQDNPDDMVVLPLPPLNQLHLYLTGDFDTNAVQQQKSDRLIQLQAQALSVLAGVGDDERDLQVATSAVGRLQLPTGSRLCVGPDRPGGALQGVLDTMRVLVLRDEDCFEGMGPARVGAWLEAAGGKFSREVDMRALRTCSTTVPHIIAYLFANHARLTCLYRILQSSCGPLL